MDVTHIGRQNETVVKMKALKISRKTAKFAVARLMSPVSTIGAAKFGPLSLVNESAPTMPNAEGWHRIQPRLTGICGSDLSLVEGHASTYFDDWVSFPFVPGHEVVADCDDGRRVVLEPVLGHACRGLPLPFEGAAPGDGEPLDLERFATIWPSVIETIRADNAMLAALFEAARPLGVSGDEVNLGFAQSASFLKRKAEDRPNRDAVINAIAALTGRRLTVTFTLVDDQSPQATGSGGVSVGPLSADDWFERFITEFDGEEISLNNEEEVTP